MKVFQKFIHITAAAFCLLIVPNILSAKFTKDGIQRITREEIRKACLMRLNELFNLIDDWQGFSVDGFKDLSSVGPSRRMVRRENNLARRSIPLIKGRKNLIKDETVHPLTTTILAPLFNVR